MLQPTEIKDTFGFRYYDHYGNRQSVTLRQGDQGGITKVNTDGTQTELAELKGVKTCDAPIPCENYNNLKPLGTSSSTVGWNTLFHESFDVMKDYYAGNITADDVSEYIRSLCSFGSLEKSQISDSLSTIYEHMSRANTRNAVNQNIPFTDIGEVPTGRTAAAQEAYTFGTVPVVIRNLVANIRLSATGRSIVTILSTSVVINGRSMSSCPTGVVTREIVFIGTINEQTDVVRVVPIVLIGQGCLVFTNEEILTSGEGEQEQYRQERV